MSTTSGQLRGPADQPLASTRRRRAAAAVTAVAVGAAGIVGLAATTPAANAASGGASQVAANSVDISGATFTWGLSGYAQKGIFGPWTYKNLTGNASVLLGTTSGGSQTTYAAEPVPATSMPPSTPQLTPNVVQFALGSGTADPATGAADLTWTGSYTVNAYPPQFNAPDEIFADPELTVAADGSGELTMNYSLGAGVDMNGDPTPAQDFGRLPIMEFSAGSDTAISLDSFRLAPDYRGVEVTLPAGGGTQTTNCTTDGGATGWWGSWPQEFVSAVPSSVRPHFYSTGCGGMQDYKPALPLDIDLHITPSVTVSDTTLLPTGEHEITVEGTGFDPAAATGTRPPLAGQPAGTYVVFGKFADVWKPSQAAPSSARKGVQSATKWAVPAAQMATIGGPAAGAVELKADGSFTTTLVIEKADADALTETGNYGIYTYPGSGGAAASYETMTPLTFAKATPTVTLSAPASTFGKAAKVSAVVTAESEPTGPVTLLEGATQVGAADLSAGEATFTLSKQLTAGRHPLTLSYAGDDNTEGGTAKATLVVAKAGTTLSSKLVRKPTTKVGGGFTLTVVSKAGVKPTGNARILLTKAKGKVIKNVTKALAAGKASITLPKLAKGQYRIVLGYPGDANHLTATRKTVVFNVTQ